jgi:hypothetical protein
MFLLRMLSKAVAGCFKIGRHEKTITLADLGLTSKRRLFRRANGYFGNE